MVESLAKTEQKEISGRKLKIYTQDASMSKALVDKMIAIKPQWKSVSDKKAELYWYTCHEDEELMMKKLEAGKIISRHPFTKEIYHKDTFSRAMRFPMECFPD